MLAKCNKKILFGCLLVLIAGTASAHEPTPGYRAKILHHFGISCEVLDCNQFLIEQQLSKHGVQVVHHGEDIRMLLPEAVFFYCGTPRIMWPSKPILNLVAAYLQSTNEIDIDVTGYTDNQGLPQRNLVLSRQRSINIAEYLWKQGVDARFMSAIGEGDANPIARNETDAGRRQNQRVEITYRQVQF